MIYSEGQLLCVLLSSQGLLLCPFFGRSLTLIFRENWFVFLIFDGPLSCRGLRTLNSALMNFQQSLQHRHRRLQNRENSRRFSRNVSTKPQFSDFFLPKMLIDWFIHANIMNPIKKKKVFHHKWKVYLGFFLNFSTKPQFMISFCRKC